MEELNNVYITEVGLPLRVVNTLLKNGVETMADLIALTDEEIMMTPGMGIAGYDAIRRAVEAYFDEGSSLQNSATMSEYLSNVNRNGRNTEIALDYYRSNSRLTLESIGEKYDITRERARQIIDKNKQKVKDGLMGKKIVGDILNKMDDAAARCTEISLVGISDPAIDSAGLVRMVAASFPKRYKIVKSRFFNGEWLVVPERDIQGSVEALINTLRERSTPMLVKDVVVLFSINEDLLFSIKNIVEKDGLITVASNKALLGFGTLQTLIDYFEKAKRPVSAFELFSNTNLTENQIRGGLCNHEHFVNVGKSVYDLVDADYCDLSICDLARNYLIAENRALKIDYVVNYIKRYRIETYREIVNQLLARESGLYRVDDYILLNEWTTDMIERPVSRSYEIVLEDALLNVFNNSKEIMNADSVIEKLKEKYGDRVSTNANSVKTMLGKLAWEEKIVRIGSQTGYYQGI